VNGANKLGQEQKALFREAVKEATLEYATAECAYQAGVGVKVGVEAIALRVQNRFTAKGLVDPSKISATRIRSYVNEHNYNAIVDNGGVSPKRRGPEPRIPNKFLECAALQAMLEGAATGGMSSTAIQNNVKDMARKNGISNTHQTEGSVQYFKRKMLKLCPELAACDLYQQEGIRFEWAQAKPYAYWMKCFKGCCLKLGLAENRPTVQQNQDGTTTVVSEIFFSEKSKRRIINLDESQVPRDAKSRNSKHKMHRVLLGTGLPHPGHVTTKDSGHETFCCIITAAGEAGPPLFIFDSSCQKPEDRKAPTKHLLNLPKVWGQFGHEERQCFTSDFAYTEKGSMDGTLWPQFVRKTLQPMYPDASPENPVLIKCVGGELSRLSLLSLLGFFG
jgi:hypothetical protein